MSRPKADIPEDQIMKLIERGYSVKDCALFFKVSPTTIRAHYEELFQTFGGGKLARLRVRDIMWAHAHKTGNQFALKYLAAEFLGYTESSTLDIKSYTSQLKEMSKDEILKLTEEKMAQLREVKEAGDE